MKEPRPGSPFPFGAHHSDGMWNFSVFSPRRISELVIGDYATCAPIKTIAFDPVKNRTGDIWHIAIDIDEEALLWGWRVEGGSQPHAGKIAPLAADPYAKLVKTGNVWGANRWHELLSPAGALISAASIPEEFAWNTPYEGPLHPHDLLIYEAHVRGYTHCPSSRVQFPGTFLGMIEKIPHMKSLGISAVELMPIYEFDESEWVRTNPVSKKPLYNYWGYSPLQFFSPMQRFGTTDDPISTSRELKQLVQACHDEQIAVILDVVYNHTGEGNEHGPAFSLKALAEDVYYLKDQDRRFANYTGCGNTLQANHPVVIDLIIQSLRHWVTEYRIDGFRFDLASALTRDSKGRPLTMSSPLEAIIHDPIVGKCLLIVEPWDASGLYQTGDLFTLNQQRRPAFLEWNDKFRDDVRIFFTGAPGATGKFATRLCGSEDIYGSTGSPKNSVNYITSHDGFSLYDLVSYHSKRNLENGEENRDGMSQNHSWNCGHEGPTKDAHVLRLRARQVKNMLVALILSQGVPMLLMGDECYTTRHGNNNAWCQDSCLNWLSWISIEEHAELTSFIATLVELRKSSLCFSNNRFLSADDIEWHGKKIGQPSWGHDDHLVAFSLKNNEGKPSLFVAFNASSKEEQIEVPGKEPWHLIIDTSQPLHKEILPVGHKVHHSIKVKPHSSVVLRP